MMDELRQTQSNPAETERALGPIVRDILNGLSGLMRSELRLARAEATHAATVAGRHAGLATAGAVIAWLGAHALVAFLIVGLGALLDNYWLSALIITVLLLGIGGLMARAGLARLKSVDKTLREATRSMKEDQQLLAGKVVDIREAAKPEFHLGERGRDERDATLPPEERVL
jgi:uncharacterized membrane protein YqjE